MFQIKFSVFEKAVIIDHPIFLSVEALKLRQGQLHIFKWNHVFFSMTLLPILRRIQRPRTEGHSSHAKYEIVKESKHIGIITFKAYTNLSLGLSIEDARSDDTRLVSTC